MANDYISSVTLPDGTSFDIKDAEAARDSHTHGNISNDGKVGTGNTLLKTVSGTVTAGPTIGTDATKFLNNKGEWAVPTDTHMNVSLAGTAITHHFILMTSVTPTNTATQHTGLGATSLWVNSADKSKFELVLGNSTTITTSGGQYGQLALYNEYNAGTYLRSANGSGWKTATVPAITGILTILTSGTAKGSDTKPVKVAATGEIQECSTYAGGTAVTLNGVSMSATAATIYAPTSMVNSIDKVLKSNGNEPVWEDEYKIEIYRL